MMKKVLYITLTISLILLILGKIVSLLALERNNDIFKEIHGENICVALNYHRIRENKISTHVVEKISLSRELTTYSIYENDFINQINMLKESGAYFASLEELEEFKINGKYPEKCVWISFDDVDESVYKVAYPILKENNIPFTLFVITGEVGNTNYNNLKMTNWDQLREMKDSGLASFGSHTHNMHHLEDDKACFLNEDNYEAFKLDIRKSKDVLKEQLGIEVKSIAYPFGDTTDKIANIAEEEGYKSAFILSPNPIRIDDNSYYQNRYLITKNNFIKGVVPWLESSD